MVPIPHPLGLREDSAWCKRLALRRSDVQYEPTCERASASSMSPSYLMSVEMLTECIPAQFQSSCIR